MALTMVLPKRTGRPEAESSTVRIYKSGIARLSPDLCIGSSFLIQVDKEKRVLVIQSVGKLLGKYKLMYSNKNARSGLLSVVSALKELGMETLEGTFAAKRRGNTIKVDLSEETNGTKTS